MATKVMPLWLQQPAGDVRTRIVTAIGLLRMAVRLSWHTGPRMLTALLAVMAITAAISPLEVVAMRQAVDALVRGHGQLAWLGVLVGVLAVAQLIRPVSVYLQSELSSAFTAIVSSRVLQAVNSWPGTGRFEDPDVANDLDFVRVESAWAGTKLVSAMFGVGLTLLTSLGTVAVLIGVAWWVPVLVLVAEVPAAIVGWQYTRDVSHAAFTGSEPARRMRYLTGIALAASEAKDVRLANAFGFLRHKQQQLFDQVDADLRGVEGSSAWRATGAALWSTLGAVSLVVLLATHGVSGRVAPGVFVAGLTGYLLLRSTLAGVFQALAQVPQGLQVLPVLERVLDAEPDLPLPVCTVRPATASIAASVEFDHVSFTYPGAESPTLRDVCLRVEPGQTVALVGHNGSGKTTLVTLLLRFHDVCEGRVLVDGVDVRDWDVAALRGRVGALFQDFARWEFTVAENIGLGDVARLDDRAAVMAAARAGNADSFVTELPQDYDTRIGHELGERNLSGGQWQRLALARANMNRSGLLVLDEPTAELDPRAEAEVFDRFADLATGRTIVLISHRFSTVKGADRIVLLDDGRIRESGSHAELMRLRGEYARMYTVQASQYGDVPSDLPIDVTSTNGRES